MFKFALDFASKAMVSAYTVVGTTGVVIGVQKLWKMWKTSKEDKKV